MALSDDFDSISELRVAGSTPPKELAASIIHLLNEGKQVTLAAIGHHAVGQAVKSITPVNQYCIAQGYVMVLLPSFKLIPVTSRELPEDDGLSVGERTAERTVTMLKLIKISPQ
jgi:stage V sporulation protein SpoVS